MKKLLRVENCANDGDLRANAIRVVKDMWYNTSRDIHGRRRAVAFFNRKKVPGDEQITYADYGSEVIEAYKGIRALRHDMRNHLDVMNALAQAERWGELSEYIRELSGAFRSLAAVTLSGNAVVDALLASKFQWASAAEIDLQAQVVLPYKTPLGAFDWTTLLGNLLDNALEACADVKAAGSVPYIRLNVTFAHGMLHIEIENSSTGRYQKHGASFASTKGKGRGLGLKRVSEVVKRHGGYIALEDQEDAFIVRIILPLEE